MNNIVKVCKIHGELQIADVYQQYSRYKDKKYPYWLCKECTKEKKKRLYKLDPKKHIAYARNTQKRYREKTMKRQNEYHVLKHMPLDDYENLLSRQNNKCAICKLQETAKHQNGKTKRLAIDHFHENGKVRGLLCGKCNTAIGLFNDSIRLLESAIKYLKST